MLLRKQQQQQQNFVKWGQGSTVLSSSPLFTFLHGLYSLLDYKCDSVFLVSLEDIIPTVQQMSSLELSLARISYISLVSK